MFSAVSRGLDRLLDHSTAAYILLALFVLSLVGAGNLVIASLVGLLLCLAGLTQGGARIDPWALAALLLYDLACLASAYACFGQFVSGYGVTHGLFPVLFLLTACLDQAEQLRSPEQKRCGTRTAP